MAQESSAQREKSMKRHYLGAFILVSGLTCLPAAAAQRQVQSPPAAVQQPAGDSSPDAGYSPQGVPPSSQLAVPALLTLPAGTLITVRTTQEISSDRNKPGDAFSTVLEQPVVTQGWVVARRGQVAEGQVAAAQPAGRVRGVSQLGLELTQLVLVDGQQVPVRTQLVQSSAGTSKGRDAAGIGTATGIGAVIGGAAGGGEGAAIGAAAGAAAGVAGVLATRGVPTEIDAETVLTFRLVAPATFSTEQSQQAFLPVIPDDYSNQGALRNPPRTYRAEGYRAPQRYYYYSPYYNYYYPPPIVGFYGYYGHGGYYWPRPYARPWGYGGHGYYRHR